MKWLLHRFPVGAGSVLCYHSLTTPDLPSAAAVNVPLDSFHQQVELLRWRHEIVPLGVMLERMGKGRSIAGLVSLTFDDAYESLELLRPLIAKGDLPVSVFVTTGAADTGLRYWWDRVADAEAAAPAWAWERFALAAKLPPSFLSRYSVSVPRVWPWRDYVVGRFAGRWPTVWEEGLAGLERDAATQTAHRSMAWEEILDFARLPGVEIGVHTVTHPVLPALPDDQVTGEITDSHAALRERLNRVLPVLAIPFGLGDPRAVRLAREAGMKYSMSVSRRTVSGNSRHPIPRFCISAQEQTWKLALRLTGITERLLGWRGETSDYPVTPVF